jgi:flagellar biosynthesis component FlhA
MFKFLFVIFGFFLLLMALLGFSVFRVFKRILFGSGDTTKQQQARHAEEQRRRNKQQTTQQTHTKTTKKKIISKDEGEYVDYEEVKD